MSKDARGGVVVRVPESAPVLAAGFPYAKFPFEYFNPPQSMLHGVYKERANVLVASSTSSGKTVCAEMVISHEIRERKGKAVFLAPLKALAQEKYDDWTDPGHHFADLKVSICTGDYQLTPERKAELEAADIIVMSSEMLNSRCRNMRSENNHWLAEVGTLVADESHLLTVAGRGDHLESGFIKFAKVTEGQGRYVLLSATLPNVDEVGQWVSSLNGMPTHVVVSSYRPVELKVHWTPYAVGQWYDDTEQSKVDAALQKIQQFPQDKFLVFVHTKNTGKKMIDALRDQGIESEFHNANVDTRGRKDLEYRFRNDKNFRVLVATSTLAWGVNVPARRVVIVGIHRGLQEVEKYDIDQMCGRAGRPQYDKEGDVYILLPNKDFAQHKARLERPIRITSQMVDKADRSNHKTLGFHLVSEIYHGTVETRADVEEWFRDTLASFQEQELGDEFVGQVLSSLEAAGAIIDAGGIYEATAVGKVASLFYYSPYDVADLKKNFTSLFKNSRENDDHALAWSLANIDGHATAICSKAEAEEIAAFARTLCQKGQLGHDWFTSPFLKGKAKVAYCYHSVLRGAISGILAGQMAALKADAGRLVQVLSALDMMAARWKADDFWTGLRKRFMYGVTGELLDLLDIPGVGAVKARKLFNAGLRSRADIAKAAPARVVLALGCSVKSAEQVIGDAKEVGRDAGAAEAHQP